MIKFGHPIFLHISKRKQVKTNKKHQINNVNHARISDQTILNGIMNHCFISLNNNNKGDMAEALKKTTTSSTPTTGKDEITCIKVPPTSELMAALRLQMPQVEATLRAHLSSQQNQGPQSSSSTLASASQQQGVVLDSSTNPKILPQSDLISRSSCHFRYHRTNNNNNKNID